MTAAQLIHEVKRTGGELLISPGGHHLYAKRVPRHLVPEVKRLKHDVIRHIAGENFRRLVRTLNLKSVSPERLKEIEHGEKWRIAGASEWNWTGARYRWGNC